MHLCSCILKTIPTKLAGGSRRFGGRGENTKGGEERGDRKGEYERGVRKGSTKVEYERGGLQCIRSTVEVDTKFFLRVYAFILRTASTCRCQFTGIRGAST